MRYTRFLRQRSNTQKGVLVDLLCSEGPPLKHGVALGISVGARTCYLWALLYLYACNDKICMTITHPPRSKPAARHCVAALASINLSSPGSRVGLERIVIDVGDGRGIARASTTATDGNVPSIAGTL